MLLLCDTRVAYRLVVVGSKLEMELDMCDAPAGEVLVFFRLIARELLPALVFFAVEVLATTRRVREVLLLQVCLLLRLKALVHLGLGLLRLL